jgi:hypothetical protein
MSDSTKTTSRRRRRDNAGRAERGKIGGSALSLRHSGKAMMAAMWTVVFNWPGWEEASRGAGSREGGKTGIRPSVSAIRRDRRQRRAQGS